MNEKHRDIFAAGMDWRDGNRDGIKYARFELNPDKKDAPTIVITKFQPGTEVDPHTHDCNYMEYIIEGEQQVGKITFGPGDVRIVQGGTGYGPITIGKDGCTVLIVFEDGSRSSVEGLPRKRKPRDSD